MNEVLHVLLSNLGEAYERKGWHGPTLRNSLRGVTAVDAVTRIGEGRHTIWELAVHAAYWKFVARRRLTGIRGIAFPRKGSNWFPSPESATDADWRDVIQLLDAEHRALRDAVAAMTGGDLRNPKKLRLVRGAAAHDVYHAGQIQLVKKLIASV